MSMLMSMFVEKVKKISGLICFKAHIDKMFMETNHKKKTIHRQSLENVVK